MRSFDVCNGDADGLLARHQWRLAYPRADVELISGTKREIALLERVPVFASASVTVFDISFDRNALAAEHLLLAGASITYFDHHQASKLPQAGQFPNLMPYIDTAADTCTSLIVDRTLNGRYSDWAIAAAFGDNLHEVAVRRCEALGLGDSERALLRQIGEAINYNAYGETVRDLLFTPAQIAARLAPHASALAFQASDDVVQQIQLARMDDIGRANSQRADYESRVCRVFILPDKPWSRRVVGDFANELSRHTPQCAHAVLVRGIGERATVSLRAPQTNRVGADRIATQFGGGGRLGAAGIDHFDLDRLPELIGAIEAEYR